MTPVELIDDREAALAEYRALNKVVGELLLVENANVKQTDDLAYYNRKLIEARRRLRGEK